MENMEKYVKFFFYLGGVSDHGLVCSEAVLEIRIASKFLQLVNLVQKLLHVLYGIS